MAEINVSWFKTENPISIREYAEYCGFNLTALENESINEEKWDWINSKIRLSILNDLRNEWNENYPQSTRFSHVKQGVYVITLAKNISIDYNGKPSQIVYIGRGKLKSRISSHLTNWISFFSESLQDICFNIWLTEIKIKGSPNAYKDLESDLIDEFYEKYETLPIQNSKYGDYHNRYHTYSKYWKIPLNNPNHIHYHVT